MDRGSTLYRKFSCAMLSQVDQDNIVWVVFLQKYVCVLWANIAQALFLCNVVSDISGQHWLDNTSMQCCLSNVNAMWSIQHCIGYFPHKSCLLAMC